MILKILAVVCFFCFLACTPKDYHAYEKRELSSGVRVDSLFLGIGIGMLNKDFYTHCWELNKQGIIREGASNLTVHYPLPEYDGKIKFEFYPIFKDDKIQSMTGYFYHDAWSPWNRDTDPDKLIEEVRQLITSWYGIQFFPMKGLGIGNAYAGVKGNLRIVLFYDMDNKIDVHFTDLTNNDGVIDLKKLS